MQNGWRQIIEQFQRSDDLTEALQSMVERVCHLLKVQVCSVYLADYEQQQLYLRATQGLLPQVVGHAALSFNQGVVGLIAQREEPLNIQDISSHPNYHYLQESGEEEFRALLGAPMIHQREVIGVLVIQQRSARRFEDSEETFVTTLASQLASVIVQMRRSDTLVEHAGLSPIRELKGLPAASGVAIGQAKVFYPPADLSAVPNRAIESIDDELSRFNLALQRSQQDIQTMKQQLASSLSREELRLFDAYAELLSRRSLGTDVEQEIAKGNWAPGALRTVVERHVKSFEAIDDAYLRERANDLMDLARRVLAHLEDFSQSRPKLETPAIVVAEEITASMLAELPREHIMGIVSVRGSSNSHAAILAKALDIPAVTGLNGVPIHRFEGQDLILDGYQGHIVLGPSSALVQQYQRLQRDERLLTQELQKELNEPSVTTDGVQIPLMVNTGLLADLEFGIDMGADGIGLYRTEIPFMLRSKFPSEERQMRMYRNTLTSFADKSVTFRTLDIGGDKQLPYFSIEEDNPFLGWRGIRVTLDHPEIFLIQIRAILRAAINMQRVNIALPMISSVEEVDESIRLIQQAYREITEEYHLAPTQLLSPHVGIILEVPSAIYQLPTILKRVDFVSIGSNDLTQYLLAVDRNNTRVSSLFNHFHPALIAALLQVLADCKRHQIPVCVCGEMAGDPLGALLLCGLGFESLSMNARSLPRVKRVIRSFSMESLSQIAHQAAGMEKSKQVHDLLYRSLEEKGLGGLVRAGS